MRLRPILALVLAAILSLTSVSVGATRAHVDPADAIVICSNGGIVTIYVDASGQPVPAPHICPDCVLLVAALPVSQGTTSRVLRPIRIAPVYRQAPRATAEARTVHARAPPVVRLLPMT